MFRRVPAIAIQSRVTRITGGCGDIWESEDAYNAFVQDRLLAALTEVSGPEAAEGDWPAQVQEVYSLIKP